MGFVRLNLKIKNPAEPEKEAEEKFLVDSGAQYTVVSGGLLKKLGLKPHRTQGFVLADGTEIKRKVGSALFEYGKYQAASPVVFGKEGDSNLLGVVTLEAFGLMLDPFKRELRPMKLFL